MQLKFKLSCRLYILVLLMALALALPLSARQRVFGWCQQGGITVTVAGFGGLSTTPKSIGSYPGCTVNVYLQGTLTTATIYADDHGTSKTNSFVADLVTGYWFFYVDDGAYDVTMSGGGLAASTTLGDLRPNDTYLTAPGGVPRTKTSRLLDVVDVKDYGATGNGVTDDTATIQAAINYVMSLTNCGAVYVPSGKYRINSDPGLVINKTNNGCSFTFYGDGPWSTQLITSITALHSPSNVISVTGSDYPVTVEGMAVLADIGGNYAIDCIRATGNGQFYRHLWLASCGSGLELNTITDVTISDSFEEHNVQGIIANIAEAVRINNNATYQNTETGFKATSPFVYGGNINGGVHEAVVISNSTFTEDGAGGDGLQAALDIDASNNVVVGNSAINSYAGSWPITGIRLRNALGSPIGKLSLANVNISHMRSIGIQADAGNLTISGGMFDQVGYVDKYYWQQGNDG
jgi:hypothetical protein